MKGPVIKVRLLSRLALGTSIVGLGLALSPAVAARDLAMGLQGSGPAAVPPLDDYADSNEIVVTATKREQTLQEVPVSVSVTTGETIARAQIRDIKDLSSLVPSLRVNQLQSSANTNFYIRGFGNGANNAGIEPSVGLFIDGVYRSRSASMIADFPDVERIEVLRGPQSTLFGKNASAGVISITTRKPQFEFGGNVEAGYGNFGAMVLKGMVTGPISDTIAASLAGGINKRDGYVRDMGADGRTNERNRWFLRGQVLYEPTAQLEVRISADYGKIDENCCAAVNLRSSAATFGIAALGGQVNSPSDPFGDVIYSNFPSTNRIENWGLSGQVDYALGPFGLTSITAYRRTDAVTNQDSDFTSADLLGRNYQDLRIKTFTQELRLSANILEKYVALLGFYYFNEKIAQQNDVQFGTQFRPYANLLIQGATGGAQSVPSVEGFFGSLQGNPGLYAGQFFAAGQGLMEEYRLKNEAYSIFAQLEAEIVDRLMLTGGINYTHDSKRFRTNVVSSDVFAGVDIPGSVNAALAAGAPPAQVVPLLALRPLQLFPPFLNVPNAVEQGKVGGGDFSFTARLAYDATDTVNLYLSYATGYKAASVNLSRDSRPTPADLVAINQQGIGLTNLTSGSRFAMPEDSTVYEAGIKADWRIASVNFAIFQQEIKGFQSNIFTGTGFFLANAGKQSSFGFEFDGMVRPVDPLTLTVALTYLDPKYDRFMLSAFGDLSGTTPGGVSPLSVTFGAQYEHEFNSGDQLILRGDYHYEAPFQLVEGLPGLVVKDPITGQVLDVSGALAAARSWKQDINDVNASITYAMTNGVEVSLWGRNLLDDRTILQIFDSPAQTGSISGYLSQPRTYGISARFRW